MEKSPAAQHKPITIAIVDNDRMALMALSSLLAREGFAIRWTAQLGAAAIQRCIPAVDRPDVLLVDMALTDMTGIDVCQSVCKWASELPMIGITAYDPAVYETAALAAGARAVLSKDDIETIARAIREAALRGDVATAPETPTVTVTSTASDFHGSASNTNGANRTHAASHNAQSPSQSSRQSPQRSFALSAQQTDIMRLYADGRSTEEIAAALGISKGTIFAQVARVRDKLHARDRNEAVALCRRYLRM